MRNCLAKVNDVEELVLIGDCELCRQTNDISYSWLIYGSVGWHEHPDVDQHRRTLTIIPGLLQQGEIYTITLAGNASANISEIIIYEDKTVHTLHE